MRNEIVTDLQFTKQQRQFNLICVHITYATCILNCNIKLQPPETQPNENSRKIRSFWGYFFISKNENHEINLAHIFRFKSLHFIQPHPHSPHKMMHVPYTHSFCSMVFRFSIFLSFFFFFFIWWMFWIRMHTIFCDKAY